MLAMDLKTSSRPHRAPRPLALPLLLPALLLHLSPAFLLLPLPAHSFPDTRPELDYRLDVLICRPGAPCAPATADNLTAPCSLPRTAVIHDTHPCWTAALELAGYRPWDLGTVSGGEAVLCGNLLRHLHRLGYGAFVTREVHRAEECVRAGLVQGINHMVFVQVAWPDLIGDQAVRGARRPRPPFREDCLLVLNYLGNSEPIYVWPGDLRYYISVWPNDHNSHLLLERPQHCPVARAHQAAPLPPYAVLFEKYKVMPPKVEATDRFAHNGTFWRELWKKVHLVVLDCSDALAEKLQWGPDYRDHVTCWKESPLRDQVSYHSLMMGAAFLLGLGATADSPTPLNMIYCRTPVVMPPYQHPVVARHAGPREFYPVASGDEVLAAADAILGGCKVEFRSVPEGVMKSNTCFQDPPSLDAIMAEDVIHRQFANLVHAKQILCETKPRTCTDE